MGKKQRSKSSKKVRKFLKAHRKKHKDKLMKKGVKDKCCDKYMKSVSKRCDRCPCYDLMKQVA